MKTEIKKITVQTPSKKSTQTPKKDTIKKLAGKPDVINNFIQDKFKNIKKEELSSWVIPSFLKKSSDNDPNKIEKIIKDIQTHRKSNQLLSKKQPKIKENIKKDTNLSIPIVDSNKDIEKEKYKNKNNDKKKQSKVNNPSKCIKNPLDTLNKKEHRGGRIKTRKEGRLYSKVELKELCNSLIDLYADGNNKKISSILRRLTKNQCNQILNYKKLIKKTWTNAPLPLLRFLVYQTISCPRIKYRIL